MKRRTPRSAFAVDTADLANRRTMRAVAWRAETLSSQTIMSARAEQIAGPVHVIPSAIHDPGPDPGAHPPAARGDQRRGHPRHARPRGGGRHRRPHRGDVRRPDRRAGQLDDIFYDPQHPYTWGLLGSITRVDRPAPGAAARDRRAASVAGRPAGWLPLPPALPTRVRAVHERAAARGRVADASAHRDRCWLTVEQKRQLREVRPGEIGLPTKEGAAV